MSTPKTSSAKRQSHNGLASLERAVAEYASRHVSLIVMHIDDLPEMRSLYGPAFYEDAIRKIQGALAKVVRGRGAGARTGSTEYTLALPDMYRRETLALLHAQLGRPVRFEIDTNGAEIVLVPEYATDMIAPGETFRAAHTRLRLDLMTTLERERARLAGMTRYRESIVARASKALQFMSTAPAALRSQAATAA